MVKQDKVYGLMGFAARSKNLITGYNTCLKMIPSGKVKLLIIGSDVGEKTRDKMMQKCNTYRVPVRLYGTCEELSHAVGKEDKGLFGITEEGFAKSLIKNIDQNIDKNNVEKEVF